MESVSKEETLEKLDQEITVNLQKIDSNLSFCFHKITQDIIPHVATYSEICERIMDSTEWLGTMFQETGLVNLQANAAVAEKNALMRGKMVNNGDIVPTSAVNSGGETQAARNGPDELDSVVGINQNPHSMLSQDNTDDFHTANITSTGQILKLPDSSDEDTGGAVLSSGDQKGLTGEDNEEANNEQDESTIQRQSRKRKISLLLQQQYGSSSSMVPSPIVPNKMRKQVPHEDHINDDGSNDDENSNNIESSPLKQGPEMKRRAENDNEGLDEEESTKEVPKPGTIIHFSTTR